MKKSSCLLLFVFLSVSFVSLEGMNQAALVPKGGTVEYDNKNKPNEKEDSIKPFLRNYFISGDGFSLDKGEIYGRPAAFDFQVGLGKGFNFRGITSLFFTPLIGNLKYVKSINDLFHFKASFFGATAFWYDLGLNVLMPVAGLTVGNRRTNFTISGGYGPVFQKRSFSEYEIIEVYENEFFINSFTSESVNKSVPDWRPLLSAGGVFEINEKFSFVFDSFWLPSVNRKYDVVDHRTVEVDGEVKGEYFIKEEKDALLGGGLFTTGLRWQPDNKNAFQGGVMVIQIKEIDNFLSDFILPLPVIQWYYKPDWR